ncbi:hypothetical protein BC833DRAFT_602515 [Globomyces pollinis-pini]|nr:hypothetical protein BC833DRAFT_602515 [Globomyces pollinis-pini]
MLYFILFPLIASQTAPAGFDAVDITRIGKTGEDSVQAANQLCPVGGDAAAAQAKSKIAEAAETSFFNAAIAAAGTAAEKAAIQCQKDRNKVFKNQCQLNAALVTGNQDQITLNTNQVKKNSGDVNTKCANVDESLFIGNGNAGQTAPSKAAPAKAAKSKTGSAPAGFDAVDITRIGKTGNDSVQAANKLCPVGGDAAAALAKSKIAEAAETSFFNGAIAAAGTAAEKAAIQCQKDRNKVFKNQCQLNSALVSGNQEQITLNRKQVIKNRGDVNAKCANVDESLFIGNGPQN